MKLSVSYHGGMRYDILAGQHRVVTDQPVADGGQDAGPSPVELFVGSIASCIGYFVGKYCGRHGIPQEGLRVEADWAMAENPHRVGHVDVSIHLPHRLTPEMEDRLLKVAHGCTVHQSLMRSPTVDVRLTPHSQPTGNRA